MMEPGVKVVVIPCPTVDYGQQTVSFPRYDLERANRMWLEWNNGTRYPFYQEKFDEVRNSSGR